jgi:hypothetical protein
LGVLGLALAAPVSAAPQVSQWHRLNPATEDQANEHERLTCFEQGTNVRCLYDKLPEEGFHFDETTGMFRGHDITDRWTCPDWFDPAVCEGVTAVYAGPATYFPEDGRPFTIRQEYVLTEVEGQPVLYQHWVGAFACPWYETFAEATAANPTAEGDCFVAP